MDVNDENPHSSPASQGVVQEKRRRFQFSLWTLMLAITLSAVFLSSVLIVGPAVAFPIGIYLLCLFPLRIKRGYEQGVMIAGRNTAIVFGGLGMIVVAFPPLFVFWIPALCVIGLLAGFFGFLLVDAIVCLWDAER